MKNDRERSAGFILVQLRNDSYKVLGLYVNQSVDVPKGHVEEGETDLEAAIRECEEESGIVIKKENMKWGKASIIIKRPYKDVILFIAETKDDPVIKKNPVSGIYEHDGYKWMSWREIYDMSNKYLKPAIIWAKNKTKNV